MTDFCYRLCSSTYVSERFELAYFIRLGYFQTRYVYPTPTKLTSILSFFSQQGNNGLRIGSGHSQYNTRDNLTISLLLHESEFYFIEPELSDILTEDTQYNAGRVSKEQFLSILADVKHVLLRAKYHTDQAETR